MVDISRNAFEWACVLPIAVPFRFFFENSSAYTLEAVRSVLCSLSWPLRSLREPCHSCCSLGFPEHSGLCSPFDRVILQFVRLCDTIGILLSEVALPAFKISQVDILKYKSGGWNADCAHTSTHRSLCVLQERYLERARKQALLHLVLACNWLGCWFCLP